jgi:acyl-CoA thioesterase
VPETSLFDRTVALTPLGDGGYGATVEPAWNGPVAPNGGVLAAMMLRAALAELGPEGPVPRTLAAHFLEVPAVGSVQMNVEVLRRRKRVSACDVRLSQGPVLVAQATIIGSAARPQAAALTRDPPAMPDWSKLAAFDAGELPSAPAFFGQVELRPALGPRIFSGADRALTGGWMALRHDDAPLDAARLCALTDLWWPAVFTMLDGPAAVPTIQLTVHLRTVSSAVDAPVFACFETRHVGEGHLEESGELWSRQGELLAESRQLALLPA